MKTFQKNWQKNWQKTAQITTACCAMLFAHQAVATNLQPAPEDIVFPDMTHSYLKQAPRYEVSDVMRLDTGLTKDQIRSLLGNPHFNEGIFGNHQWNYMLDIRVPSSVGGQAYVRCQLRVDYDNQIAKQLHWRGEEGCFTLHNKQKHPKQKHNEQPQAIAPVVPVHKADKLIEQLAGQSILNTEALFAFDKYELQDILPDGLALLDEAANKLTTWQVQGVKGYHIFIVGYSDHLGGKQYNTNLSQRRADTVRDYLISKGVKPANMTAKGIGGINPVKTCPNMLPYNQLIDCLQPNRRVIVNVKLL